MSTGFIILRHVNSKETDKYWKLSYQSVRKYFPENQILIIDDNSNYSFVDVSYQEKLYKTKIIRSEYPGRGELLPYYYYLRNKLFDQAVIIHDSVFINSKIDLNIDRYKIIWHFKHHWDQPSDEIRLLKTMNNSKELLSLHSKKNKWVGCFGGMSIISHDYLKKINDRYDISKLLPHIKTRYNRKSFERVIGCLLQINFVRESLLGDICRYCDMRMRFHHIKYLTKLPIIKVWTGR